MVDIPDMNSEIVNAMLDLGIPAMFAKWVETEDTFISEAIVAKVDGYSHIIYLKLLAALARNITQMFDLSDDYVLTVLKERLANFTPAESNYQQIG